MKCWFVFPRQMMLPFLTPFEQAAALVGTAGNLIPGMLLGLALVSRQPAAWLALAGCLFLFGGVYCLQEYMYLSGRTPVRRWILVLISALLSPFMALGGLFSDDIIEWRGQRLRVLRGGRYQRL